MRLNGETGSLLKESAYFVLAAVFLGFAVNLFHPRGYVPVGRETIEERRIVFITVEEAKIKHRGGQALFIDTRPAREYGEGRIPGAVNIPANPESVSLNRIREYFPRIKAGVETVLYCDGETCGSSEVLARHLLAMGYSRHLYIITEGIPRWAAAGHPLQKGDQEEVKNGLH